VLAVVLILTPIAFAGGLWLAARFFSYRPDPRAARLIDLLVGAAAVAFALNIALAVRGGTGDEFAGWSRGETVAVYIIDALWYSGALLALAAIVHLLAGGRERGVARDPAPHD
jgi:hypothetical protein